MAMRGMRGRKTLRRMGSPVGVGVGATSMRVDARGWMDVYMCDVLTVLLCVCVHRIAAQHCEPDDGCSEEDRDQR